MSGAEKDQAERSKVRMKRYFILAAVLVIIMALLSSLGEAFIYIFSGLSFFFAFLGWQNWRDSSRDSDFGNYNRSERASTVSFTERLKTVMKKQSTAVSPGTATPLTEANKRVIMLASAFVGGIFFIIVAIVVLTSSGDSIDESYLDFKIDGDNLYYKGSYDSAYLIYHRGILEDEDFMDGYLGIAKIKAQAKQYDSALYYYDKTLEIDPENYNAAYGKALLFYDQQNFPRSRQELKYIFAKTDQYPDAFLLAGDSYYVNSQYDSAIGYYESAYNLGSRSKELLNIMAYIYDLNGNQGKAIYFYKETLGIDSTMTDVYKRLGELIPGEEGNIYRMRGSGQQW